MEHGRRFLQENNKEKAYICLTWYLHRFTDQVKKHPQYKGLSDGLKSDVVAVRKVVERLHDELLETYKNDYVLAQMETISIGQYDGSDCVNEDYKGLYLENKILGDDLHQNICFINSIMQCLFAIPQFIQVIDQMDQQFGTRFRAVLDGNEHSMEFLRLILINEHPNFALGNQCDAYEFLLALLNYFGLVMLENSVKEESTCKNCKETSSKYAPGADGVQIPFRDVDSLQTLLDSYLENDMTNDMVRENCHSCMKLSYINVRKWIEMDEVFVFKIDLIDENFQLVSNTNLGINDTLNINNKVFSVIGLVHQIGIDNNGHFIASLKYQEKWIVRDDMKDPIVVSHPPSQPYIVFCVQRKESDVIHENTITGHIVCAYCKKSVLAANIKKHNNTKSCLKAKDNKI